jgi:hypothetical protein
MTRLPEVSPACYVTTGYVCYRVAWIHDPQHSYPMCNEDSSPVLKEPGREADNSPPASSEVKKIWIYTSSPPDDFRQIKTDRVAFESINQMTVGHTTLKASLKRVIIVSTAECECGDGLKTEEHIFWDCNLCRENRTLIPFELH